MTEYWKYQIEIPGDLSEYVKSVQDNNAVLIKDTLWVLTLNDQTLEYIKENKKSISGVHIIPFMTENGALDSFVKNLGEIVDWMIYDDADKKFVENFMVLPPKDLYAECVPLCDKQIYISAKDVKWPEAKLTCFDKSIEDLELVCSFDKNNHAQVLCSKETEDIMSAKLASEMSGATVVPGGYEYEGDFYINESDLPKYGFEIPPKDPENPTPPIRYKIISKKVFNMTFDTRFGAMVGSVVTGVHTGTKKLIISYLARPDQMDDN